MSTNYLRQDADNCEGSIRERVYNAADEIDRLRAEVAALKAGRDEARREACALRVLCTATSQNCEQIAAARGWDCFATPHTNTTDVPVQNGGE